jgi:hypothetical protein
MVPSERIDKRQLHGCFLQRCFSDSTDNETFPALGGNALLQGLRRKPVQSVSGLANNRQAVLLLVAL